MRRGASAAGRPPLPVEEQRQPLHNSILEEDRKYLDELLDKRRFKDAGHFVAHAIHYHRILLESGYRVPVEFAQVALRKSAPRVKIRATIDPMDRRVLDEWIGRGDFANDARFLDHAFLVHRVLERGSLRNEEAVARLLIGSGLHMA